MMPIWERNSTIRQLILDPALTVRAVKLYHPPEAELRGEPKLDNLFHVMAKIVGYLKKLIFIRLLFFLQRLISLDRCHRYRCRGDGNPVFLFNSGKGKFV